MFAGIVFTIFAVISLLGFPRPGISFVLSFPGIALIGATVFLINAHYLKKLSLKERDSKYAIYGNSVFRNCTRYYCKW